MNHSSKLMNVFMVLIVAGGLSGCIKNTMMEIGSEDQEHGLYGSWIAYANPAQIRSTTGERIVPASIYFIEADLATTDPNKNPIVDSNMVIAFNCEWRKYRLLRGQVRLKDKTYKPIAPESGEVMPNSAFESIMDFACSNAFNRWWKTSVGR